MLNYLILFLLAIVFSTFSAMAGLGGGLFMIPVLILLFDLPVKYVAGTMLLAMIPYAGVATLRNIRYGFIDYRIGIVMEVGAVLGVTLGSRYTTVLPDLLLRVLFILVVCYMLLTMQIRKESSKNLVARFFLWMNLLPPHIRQEKYHMNRIGIPALFITGFVAGVFSGLLGIGGGFLITPTLIVGVMLSPKTAVGTSLFMILLTATAGSITHAMLGHINYLLSGVVAAGMILGAYAGTASLKRLPEKQVKTVITIVLSIAAVLILFR